MTRATAGHRLHLEAFISRRLSSQADSRVCNINNGSHAVLTAPAGWPRRFTSRPTGVGAAHLYVAEASAEKQRVSGLRAPGRRAAGSRAGWPSPQREEPAYQPSTTRCRHTVCRVCSPLTEINKGTNSFEPKKLSVQNLLLLPSSNEAYWYMFQPQEQRVHSNSCAACRRENARDLHCKSIPWVHVGALCRTTTYCIYAQHH